MLDNTLTSLGLQFARLQFWSNVDTVQPMTQFFRGAQNALIVLPVGYDNAMLAGTAIRKYRERLSNVHLTIVHSSTRSTPLSEFPRSEVVRVDADDINRFSLPKKSLIKRIMTRPYDVAVDMNLDFVLHTAYICKVSRAKVRVGFAHPRSDMFFNVQLNFDMKRAPQALYEEYAACLAMF
jgi:hypothetical protein